MRIVFVCLFVSHVFVPWCFFFSEMIGIQAASLIFQIRSLIPREDSSLLKDGGIPQR